MYKILNKQIVSKTAVAPVTKGASLWLTSARLPLFMVYPMVLATLTGSPLVDHHLSHRFASAQFG